MSGSSARAPEAEPGRWTRIAERGSLFGMRLTVACYRAFGRRLSLVLVHAVVAYFFLTDRVGRAASLAYLRRVWSTPEGRAVLGRPPDTWTSFLHYRAFALSIVDRLAIWFGRAGEFEYALHGVEYFDALAEQGRGSIVLGAHLGSFDALRLLAERRRSRVNVLMFTANAQRINAIFREISPDVDARVIQVDPGSVQSVFAVRECIERGEVVAILGDRLEVGDRGRASRVPFFGDGVDLPQAPFLLGALLGCPVVLMLALRAGHGRYEVFAEPLAEGVRASRAERDKLVSELLTAYASRLEHYCKRAPLQWFNFFDYWGDASRGKVTG